MFRYVLLWVIVGLLSNTTYAHGDLHERIQKITQQIKEDPDNEQLYFDRGKLYYQHHDFEEAKIDFLTAINLGYKRDDIAYWQGQTYLSLEQPDSGVYYMTPFIEEHPKDVKALRIYAKLLEQNNNAKEATEYYISVIEKANKNQPENYIELSNCLCTQERYQEAIIWLEKGIDDLGEIITLQQAMIAIYSDLGHYESAVDIYDKIIEKATRKEQLYYEAAELLYAGGMYKHSYEYLKIAEGLWDDLPQRIQNTPAMQTLKSNLNKLHQKL